MYIETRVKELNEIINLLTDNPDPEVNKNAAYVIRQLLNLGSNVNGAKELLKSVLSPSYLTSLMLKLKTNNQGLTCAVADILHSMITFIIENEAPEELEEEDLDSKEPDIPMNLLNETVNKKKIEVGTDGFKEAFANGIEEILENLKKPACVKYLHILIILRRNYWRRRLGRRSST